MLWLTIENRGRSGEGGVKAYGTKSLGVYFLGGLLHFYNQAFKFDLGNPMSYVTPNSTPPTPPPFLVHIYDSKGSAFVN